MNEKPVLKSSHGSPKMQQVERYGVIALVFLLVTIVAVSFWGDSKSPGFWSRLTGKHDAKKETALVATAPDQLVVDHFDPNIPLSPSTTPPAPIEGTPLANGNTPSAADMPSSGTGTIGAAPQNSFAPTPGAVQPAESPLPIVTPPVLSSTTTYTIQSGDSLALIAKRQLGAESRWTEIQAANPGLDPKRLRLGATIQLPAGAAVQAPPKTAIVNTPQKATSTAKPKSTPSPKTEVAKSGSRPYTIKKGDLLRSIARTQLGNENRWKDIQALNPGLDPTKLVVGATIRLPGSGATRAATPAAKPSTGTVLAAVDNNKPRVK